ncbi:MAG: hypothetical protein AAF430_24625 [Myxococcota bacterium]
MSDVDLEPELAELFKRATKEPLVPDALRAGPPILDQAAVEARLPHRDPILLVDRVYGIDRETPAIAARYDIARASGVLAGHFPRYPVWPGVLQVEAVGQAGLVLYAELSEAETPEKVALTHVRGARFLHEIVPGEDVEILARTLDDGLFVTILGQCLQAGRICSVAAVTAL